MKLNTQELILVTVVLGFALCSGCQGQKAQADEISAVSGPGAVTTEGTAAAATPAVAPGKPSQAAVVVVPASPPVAPTDAAYPPGSIIITNGAQVPVASNPVANAPAAPAASAPAETNVISEAVPPSDLNLAPALTEVVKLVQAGVGEDVLMAYITNSTEIFNMGSDEILYLHDLGVPDNVITTLIQQDSTPAVLAAKKAAAAVQPLPPGVGLSTPATGIYPPTVTQASAPATDATNLPPPAPGAQAPAVVYTVPATTQPVTVNYFYDELAPYGTWVEVPGYGRCWRPTISVWNHGWRPYADGGRWLWTDSGWYWYSDYSWGWAPFHYGRWTSHAHFGWVWVPDVHWGPAWVSWRSSSSYCGWAPLPPSARWVAGHGFYHNSLSVGLNFEFGLLDFNYVYLPFNRFCDRRPSRYYVEPHRAREIHRETTVVNNYVSVDNTVVNRGVGYDRVAAVNRGSLRRVSLRPTSEVPRGTLRRELLESDGRTLTVARPVNASADPGSRSTVRSVPSAPSVRPQTGRASATFSSPSTGGGAFTPRSSVPRGTTRTAPTAVSTPAPVVTTAPGDGGRTVPAPPRSATADAPRGGRPFVRPSGETQARLSPPVTSTPTPVPAPAAPVVRVPSPAPRTETPRGLVRPPSNRAPSINTPAPSPARAETPRFVPANPSFNSPRSPASPAPSPRSETFRAPSPAPSAPRSVPAPSPAPSGGDRGSRPSRSSGDDNGNRRSR